jgi:hypothetical protein
MQSINFAESNLVLTHPTDMTEEECKSLPVWSNGVYCVSVWNASLLDRVKFIFTNRLYLIIKSGNTQPPVRLTFDNPLVTEPKPNIPILKESKLGLA